MVTVAGTVGRRSAVWIYCRTPFRRVGLTPAADGTSTTGGIFERVRRLEESSAPAGRMAQSCLPGAMALARWLLASWLLCTLIHQSQIE